MVTQEANATVAVMLGVMGTIAWTITPIPQMCWIYQQKSTDGMPTSVVLLWAASAIPYGAYSIIQRFNLPLEVQGHTEGFLWILCFAQCMYYAWAWRVWTACLFALSLLAAFGALEALLVVVVGQQYLHGSVIPVDVLGVLAAILVVAGYMELPIELVKHRGRVVGVSFVFIALDLVGALCNLLSVVLQNKIDVIWVGTFGAILLIQSGVLTSHLVWSWRTSRSAGYTRIMLTADVENKDSSRSTCYSEKDDDRNKKPPVESKR